MTPTGAIDPEICHVCGGRARVIDSRRCAGYRRRRHQCATGCRRADGRPVRWTSYQSRANPRRAIRRLEALKAARTTQAPRAAATPQAVGGRTNAPPRRRRAVASRYLTGRRS